MTVHDQPLDKLKVIYRRPNVVFDVKIGMLALKNSYLDMWKHILPHYINTQDQSPAASRKAPVGLLEAK